jgi:6-phosphogluconate dehydrogenase
VDDMKVGFVGLGKMGQQIVGKFLQHDHEVVVYDVNENAIKACVDMGAISADSREDLVGKLGDNPIVWLMIPSDYVQAEVDAYLTLLPKNAILIDGGNSEYQLTIGRSQAAKDKGISYVDVGTSGGVMGLENGFSLMIGGDQASYNLLMPFFEALVQPSGGFAYMGDSGSGHYVKMIHNGIEYAVMQSYAEGYDLLKYGKIKGLNLTDIAEVWQQGSIIKSSLNNLIHEILVENYELEGIDGYVADSGEGRWTYETAQNANVPMPALREALEVRKASQNGYSTFATKLLAAMRNKFGGHAINK